MLFRSEVTVLEQKLIEACAVAASITYRRHHAAIILERADIKQELFIWAWKRREKLLGWLDDTQDEIDYYWDLFSKEGSPGKCGWIKDKYGVNWQVVPSMLGKLMSDPQTAPKAVYAFLQMSKFIIDDLEKAVN